MRNQKKIECDLTARQHVLTGLGRFQFAFARDAFVCFVSTPDAILALTVAIGQNLGNGADTIRHILTNCSLRMTASPTLNFGGIGFSPICLCLETSPPRGKP